MFIGLDSGLFDKVLDFEGKAQYLVPLTCEIYRFLSDSIGSKNFVLHLVFFLKSYQKIYVKIYRL